MRESCWERVVEAMLRREVTAAWLRAEENYRGDVCFRSVDGEV